MQAELEIFDGVGSSLDAHSCPHIKSLIINITDETGRTVERDGKVSVIGAMLLDRAGVEKLSAYLMKFLIDTAPAALAKLEDIEA